MSREDFIIHVYCFVDYFFQKLTQSRRLRRRGPSPLLSDTEVIVMQLVGEFLGMDSDKAIWEYFRANWSHFFPNIGDRTTFVKQAGNLCYWIERLHKACSAELGAIRDDIHITDGFPIPICNFKRAHFSKIFKGDAAYGFCAAKGQTYYGFKGHVVINSIGVISHFTFAASNIDERDILPENISGITGRLLGDKGLIRPELSEELAQREIKLEHPLRDNMQEVRTEEYLKEMKNKRRLIETVIAQLTERFNIEKMRARNIWRASLRLTRKILAHTIGMLINQLIDRPLLQFESLVG
jgi:DDE family transposase